MMKTPVRFKNFVTVFLQIRLRLRFPVFSRFVIFRHFILSLCHKKKQSYSFSPNNEKLPKNFMYICRTIKRVLFMPYYYPLGRLNKTERLRTVDNLLSLRSRLDRDIPQKTATDTLLLATWNIREFGNNRRKESLHYIAEIVSRFDLVAIQEVAANRKGLIKKLLSSFLAKDTQSV
jgi:hypothetical protein